MRISFPTLVLILTTSCLLTGCQRYGEISKDTYKFANALYSISNLQDEERLKMFRDDLKRNTDVPANEKRWLMDIVELSENGQWEQANQQTRQMLDEQITGL